MIIRIGKNGIVYKGIWRLYFTGISKIFAHDGTIGGVIPIPIRFEKNIIIRIGIIGNPGVAVVSQYGMLPSTPPLWMPPDFIGSA